MLIVFSFASHGSTHISSCYKLKYNITVNDLPVVTTFGLQLFELKLTNWNERLRAGRGPQWRQGSTRQSPESTSDSFGSVLVRGGKFVWEFSDQTATGIHWNGWVKIIVTVTSWQVELSVLKCWGWSVLISSLFSRPPGKISNHRPVTLLHQSEVPPGSVRQPPARLRHPFSWWFWVRS